MRTFRIVPILNEGDFPLCFSGSWGLLKKRGPKYRSLRAARADAIEWQTAEWTAVIVRRTAHGWARVETWHAYPF